MTAKSIMNTSPIVLHLTDKVGAAADIIMEHRFRSIPVVDDDNRFIGVFSINCLLKVVLPPAMVIEGGLRDVSFIQNGLSDLHKRFVVVENESVGICVNQDVTIVHPDTPLMESLFLLYNTRAALPVVEKDTRKLAGVISYWDVGRKVLDAEI